jgi:adenylate cyclase
LSYVGLAIALNFLGSLYNLVYNDRLVVARLSPSQQSAFWNVAVPGYNTAAWGICLALIIWPLMSLIRCHWDLQAGREVDPVRLEQCRCRLLGLPRYQVRVIFWGWMLGGICFPLGICLLGGWENGWWIWPHFLVSFLISALVSTTQTFFVLETFLIKVLYPAFFRDARPADVLSVRPLTLRGRLLLYWWAVAVVPLMALLVVALNATAPEETRHDFLRWMGVGVFLGGISCSGLISWLIGRDLLEWVQTHTRATEEISQGNYAVRILSKRPDEFGQLIDRFNDMAAGLQRAQHQRETFGEFVEPEVAAEILDNDPGLKGQVVNVTVLFVDIRGFTHRSSGMPPEQAVALLNRFLTLAVLAIRQNEGMVNKFLGDGLMALFGAPRRRGDHADMAVSAARGLLAGLEHLNHELAAEGLPPLRVGIGIHTGPALVGCIGTTWTEPSGRGRTRREYTAIGETVNLAQRIEALTKTAGGPILISEATRSRLRHAAALTCLGPHTVAGYDGKLVVYRVDLSES